jgi:FkbM family methyltransferase
MGEDGLERTHRDHAEPRIAVSSQMKRDAVDEVKTDQRAPSRDAAGSMKASARKAARGLYRAAKPVVGPVTSRIRWYLIAPLLHELQMAQVEARDRQDAVDEALRGLLELERRLDRVEHYAYEAARGSAVDSGSDTMLVETTAGVVACPASEGTHLSCLVETGQLAVGTALLVRALLTPGRTYIDVGAHLGLHTLAAARALGGQGRIVAFEPYEPARRLLHETVRLNDLADIVQLRPEAVSSEAGVRPLYLAAGGAHRSLFPPELAGEGGDQSAETDVVSLDGVIDGAAAVQLVRIEAAGAELEVIAGARSLIETNEEIALIVDFGRLQLRRTSTSAASWLSTFEALGLMYQVIDERSGRLEVWPLERLEQAGSVHLLFARPFAEAWRRAGRPPATPARS